MITYPKPLKPGDTVAIASPASIINPDYVAGAAEALSAAGYNVSVMPHALGSCGSYAAEAEERFKDFHDAFCDPAVRAILCSRGGYGCVHLLEALDRIDLAADPKWLIGFSDVSALHALMSVHGIASIHGSMAKALALHPLDFEPNSRLLDIIQGRREPLSWQSHPFNRLEEATGELKGGNLAVIQALISTKFDVFTPGSILFIEDIAEPIYKVERILYQLRLSGILDRAAALIIGQFTDYRPDRNYRDIYQMIDETLRDVSCPVAFNAPIGHIDENEPVIYGAKTKLSVSDKGATLSYL